MKVKRFFAQSMAEALKQVSHEMGPDAVILSNRRVDGGVEIVTALDYYETWRASVWVKERLKPPTAPAWQRCRLSSIVGWKRS